MPFYHPKTMKRDRAGASYSSSEGVWVTGDRIIFGVIDKPAGTGSRPHRHPNEQFIFVQKGRLRAMVDGKKKTIPAGGIIHIPANALHSIVATDEEDVVFIVAKDTSWEIHGIIEDASALGAYIGKGARKGVAAELKNVAAKLEDKRKGPKKRAAPKRKKTVAKR